MNDQSGFFVLVFEEVAPVSNRTSIMMACYNAKDKHINRKTVMGETSGFQNRVLIDL